jgi:hypothetical protein
VNSTSETLLHFLNETGLWRNPLWIRILSSELGISRIALKGRVVRRGIIRGPYIIDDREHRAVPGSKRILVLKSYAELDEHQEVRDQPSRREFWTDFAKLCRVTHNGSPRVREYGQAYDRLSGSHEARVRQMAKSFRVYERSVIVSLRKAWGIPEWQRRIGKTRQTRAEGYAEEFKALKKRSPQERIERLAKKYKVTPDSMRRALQRYWGVQKFSELVPPRPRITRSSQYARAFEQGRGDPASRIRQIAKKYGVQPGAVRTALKRFWGPDRYCQKKLPIRRNPEALLALMNDPKIQKSDDAVGAAAKRLGIKRQSLMSILSRKGVRRSGGRYVAAP